MINTNHLGASTRIERIDVLRGCALAGIFYAHMIFWYTGAALPPSVYFKYDGFIDTLAIAIFGAFVFGKFFSVFSFLFGLSFQLQLRKNQSKKAYVPFYLWRLFLLLLIGLFHHNFWRGDILTIYALLGALLLVFRKLPGQLILGIALILITNLPIHVYDLVITLTGGTGKNAINFPMAGQAERYYHTISEANFIENLMENWYSWPAKIYYQFESGRIFMTLGYFLLGLYAGQKNLFTHFEPNKTLFVNWNRILQWALLVLLAIGLFFYIMDYVRLPRLQIIPPLQWISNLLFSIYNAVLSIYIITGISLLYQKEKYQKKLRPLAAMGRMALTNYLLQSLFGVLIFYNFGLGWFDHLSPSVNILLAILIFYLQLRLSQIWLTYFKQGPIEWLWKSASQFKFFPNAK